MPSLDNKNTSHINLNGHVTPAEITVYSWEMPDGYDYTAETSDPMEDCVELSSEVHFTLNNSQPDERQISDTGEYRPGAVHFENLHPGDYSLDGVEDGETTDDQIFWECFGFEENVVRSVVVNDHHALQFSILGGEHVMCHRFHIPHGS